MAIGFENQVIDSGSDEFAQKIAAVPQRDMADSRRTRAEIYLPDPFAGSGKDRETGLGTGSGQVKNQAGLLVLDRPEGIGVVWL